MSSMQVFKSVRCDASDKFLTVVFDVDGVLTDGHSFYTNQGKSAEVIGALFFNIHRATSQSDKRTFCDAL
jgi:hypothetical protein